MEETERLVNNLPGAVGIAAWPRGFDRSLPLCLSFGIGISRGNPCPDS